MYVSSACMKYVMLSRPEGRTWGHESAQGFCFGVHTRGIFIRPFPERAPVKQWKPSLRTTKQENTQSREDSYGCWTLSGTTLTIPPTADREVGAKARRQPASSATRSYVMLSRPEGRTWGRASPRDFELASTPEASSSTLFASIRPSSSGSRACAPLNRRTLRAEKTVTDVGHSVARHSRYPDCGSRGWSKGPTPAGELRH